MAHLQQQRFCILIRSVFPEYFKNKVVLDVGSADINGNNRYLFQDCDYCGIDTWKGNNVNITWRGMTWPMFEEVIICTEALEHDSDWAATMANMVDKSGDMLLMTCASTTRAEHGTERTTPSGSPFKGTTYYRNLTPRDILPIIDGMFECYILRQSDDLKDLYFVGFKKKPVYNPSRLTFLRLYVQRFILNRIIDWRNGLLQIFR
jgi:hypothetical protein